VFPNAQNERTPTQPPRFARERGIYESRTDRSPNRDRYYWDGKRLFLVSTPSTLFRASDGRMNILNEVTKNVDLTMEQLVWVRNSDGLEVVSRFLPTGNGPIMNYLYQIGG
jgi:hypothetical protein